MTTAATTAAHGATATIASPATIRTAMAISAALKELEELGRLRVVSDSKRKDVLVNPALLFVGE